MPRQAVGPYAFDPMPSLAKRYFLEGVQIEGLQIGAAEGEIGRDFGAGQAVFVVFRASGFSIDAGKAKLQADLIVQDPDQNVVLNRANLIDSSVAVGRHQTAKFVTRFTLHPQATKGDYRLTLTLRNLFGNRKTEESLSFQVR